MVENELEAFQISDTQYYDFNDVPEKIEQLGFSDIYVKYRGVMFANALKEKFPEYEISSSLHHGKSTIYIILKDNDKYGFRIQIEGNQYRYCFLPKWTNDEEIQEEIAEKLLLHQLWFNGTKKYRKDFCRYGKNFIYRYQKIEKPFNKEKITYSEIIKLIQGDIKNFENNFKQIEKLIGN